MFFNKLYLAISLVGLSGSRDNLKRENVFAESIGFNLISGVAIQSYFVFPQFGFTHGREKKKKALAKCVQIVKCQLNVIFQVWHSNRAL